MASNYETLVIEAVKLQQRKDAIDARLDVIKGLFREMGEGEYHAPSAGSIKVGRPVERAFKGVRLELNEDKLDSDVKTQLVAAGVLRLTDEFTKASAAKVQIILNEVRKKEAVEAA